MALKKPMTASEVNTISRIRHRVATFENHENNCSTGSAPARANTARMPAAISDCSPEPRCGL
ncbi:hypothetical protein D3C80_1790710 [compost metagenome]